MTKLIKTAAWQALSAHANTLKSQRIENLLTAKRVEQMHLDVAGIYLDYSKNLIDDKAIDLLIDLATTQNLSQAIKAMTQGEVVNITEQRQALHMALRQSFTENLNPDIPQAIDNELEKMYRFIEDVPSHITDVINLGIGGSHLGPKMVTKALSDYANSNLRCHFVANIDASEIKSLLNRLNPDNCLFIISSKSFNTLETIQNAKTVKAWLGERKSQFVAITANVEKAREFGVLAENIFQIWDFVGGRYSLWSTMGLAIALMIGRENFQALLHGARLMDQHFVETPFQHNMPVILGLLSVWYINFFNTSTQAILPYSHHLRYLPAHLQQLDMESCGKSVTQQGEVVDYKTGSIIWGEAGTIGQHSFHQLLHQGTYDMPIDFILPISPHPHDPHQNILIASCLSQSQSLMMGNPNADETHKMIPGNKPSNVFILDQLTPQTLGALIACYEHKVFVQASIWNINPFDQFGVELGKRLTDSILHTLEDNSNSVDFDPSTQSCLNKIQALLSKS